MTRLIELLEIALESAAIIDRQPMQPGDVPITFADITKAKKLLGYDPSTKIEEGIPKFIEWFKSRRSAAGYRSLNSNRIFSSLPEAAGDLSRLPERKFRVRVRPGPYREIADALIHLQLLGKFGRGFVLSGILTFQPAGKIHRKEPTRYMARKAEASADRPEDPFAGRTGTSAKSFSHPPTRRRWSHSSSSIILIRVFSADSFRDFQWPR